jgi:hypothetical protein
MRFLFIVGCLTWLTIFVSSSVCAQNTMPEDEKGPSHLQQDKPPQEQPNPLPADKMNEPGSISTGQGETKTTATSFDGALLILPQQKSLPRRSPTRLLSGRPWENAGGFRF